MVLDGTTVRGVAPSWSTLSVILSVLFCTEIDNLLDKMNSSLNYEGTNSHTLNCVYR